MIVKGETLSGDAQRGGNRLTIGPMCIDQYCATKKNIFKCIQTICIYLAKEAPR